MNINKFQLSDHFNLAEFQCPHCKVVKLSPELIEALENLRTMLHGHPIIILKGGGYRCKHYNNLVYKRLNEERIAMGLQPVTVPRRSMHTQGLAADLANHFFTDADIDALHDLGFNGIGLGIRKTHLDIRPGELVKWSYDDA